MAVATFPAQRTRRAPRTSRIDPSGLGVRNRDLVRHREDLIGVLIEQQMIIAKVCLPLICQ